MLVVFAVVPLTLVTRARNEDYRSAESIWRTAVAATPDNPRALLNLGDAVRRQGRLDEAEALFRGALALWPPYGRAEAQLGVLALDRGDREGAIAHFQRALELEPRLGDIRTNLGGLLLQVGRDEEAVAQWREALARDPGLALAANNLAFTLATHRREALRDGEEAVRLALHSAELTHFSDAAVLDTLAAAYAEAGRWAEAVATGRRALALAEAGGDTAQATQIRARLSLYATRRPYREGGREREAPR